MRVFLLGLGVFGISAWHSHTVATPVTPTSDVLVDYGIVAPGPEPLGFQSIGQLSGIDELTLNADGSLTNCLSGLGDATFISANLCNQGRVETTPDAYLCEHTPLPTEL